MAVFVDPEALQSMRMTLMTLTHQAKMGKTLERCTDCDYTICEDCSKPENQGES